MIKSHTSKQISGVGFFYYGRIEGNFVLSSQLIPFQVRSHSYDPPMFLLTKLDEALIPYKRKSGGSSSLVPCINGGRYFLLGTKTNISCDLFASVRKMN